MMAKLATINTASLKVLAAAISKTILKIFRLFIVALHSIRVPATHDSEPLAEKCQQGVCQENGRLLGRPTTVALAGDGLPIAAARSSRVRAAPGVSL